MMAFFQFCILLIAISIGSQVLAQDGEPGKFEVHNKDQGELKIHATKDQASIEANAHSVKLVFEPGQEAIPQASRSDIDTAGGKLNLIKVKRPVVFAADLQGLKRSEVADDDRDSQMSGGMDEDSPVINGLDTFNIEEEYNKAMLQGQKAFQDSLDTQRWNERKGSETLKDEMNRKEKISSSNSHYHHRKHHRSHRRHKTHHYHNDDDDDENEKNDSDKDDDNDDKKSVIGSKKSEIYHGMTVHGQSGGLHVHAGAHEVNLTSESGNIVMFLENPRHRLPVEAPHKSDVTVTQYATGEIKKKDNMELASSNSLHLVDDVTGLKKSNVSKSPKRKFLISKQALKVKHGNKRSKHGLRHPCVNGKLPPCTL